MNEICCENCMFFKTEETADPFSYGRCVRHAPIREEEKTYCGEFRVSPKQGSK